jgi:muramoyltetrapeptide carboxypeptidase
MQKIIPQRLRDGDTIRVIAPSRSMSILSEQTVELATRRLCDLGFNVTFGKNVLDKDEFDSSAVGARIEDLHEAFADSSVKAILTVIGGFNSNQLLNQIDYSLIKKNPKIICGYSDITALANAIYARTGVITYSGPHFSSFAMQQGLEYTIEYFRKCLMSEESIELIPSKKWSNDFWWLQQDKREFISSDGPRILNRGGQNSIEGTILGGNISAFAALHGTKFMPAVNESTILFLEECKEQPIRFFDRLLQSITQQDYFSNVKAILLGRFEKHTAVTDAIINQVIRSKGELGDILVVGNLNFGHTTPIFTFPIGGDCRVELISDLKIVIKSGAV